MRVLQMEVVIRPIHVGGDHRGELAAVLRVVGLVGGVDQTLRIRVSEVGVVGRSVMNHRLVNWVSSFVRENASRETRDQLLNLERK